MQEFTIRLHSQVIVFECVKYKANVSANNEENTITNGKQKKKIERREITYSK